YISHDEEEQKEAFREIKLKKWMFPLGCIRKKPTGLYFLQIMKWGVLQYTVLRPACTLAALILNYIGWYCEASWSPIWGHIWLVTIISISVTIAMYCLLQLYMPISDLLKPYSPILKFLSVKAVVFLTFWQGTFLAVLASFGVVKDTPYMTAEEINIGFGALLETFEMVIFAFLHLKAFTYLPYKPKPEDQPDFKPTSRLRSLGHVLDPRDMFRQIWKGCVYMWNRMRGYEPDTNERYSHFQRALGQRRLRGSGDKEAKESDPLAANDRFERKIPPQREHPWLKLDSPTSPENSRPDGLEQDINSELRRLRAESEYNRRQKQLREEKRERRKRGSGGSSHRRDAAAVEKYAHLPTGGEDIFTRMDGEDDTFPKRVDGYRAAPGKPSFWRGWYDRISQGGNGGGHSAIPQTDEDPFVRRDWSPPARLVRGRDGPNLPSPRDAPRETGMVVLSRPPRPTSPPPPSPPPKDHKFLSPTGSLPPGAGAPVRADSFMRRVFTAEVASSDSHTPTRSSMNVSQELLGPLSGPLVPGPISEASESTNAPVEQLAMKNIPGRYSQSAPRGDSLVLPLPASNPASTPVKFPSPKQSQQGSVYGGSSAEGPVSSSLSAGRPRAHSQPLAPRQSQPVQRAQSRGPRRPSGIVLPTPLSPARYPGLSSPTSPSLPSPPRLPAETRPVVGSGSRYPVFVLSPSPTRRTSLVGDGTRERAVRPRASSQESGSGPSRSGRRSSIDGYPGGDRPSRQMAPAPSNHPPQRLPNAYQTVEFPMTEAYPQNARRGPQDPRAQGGPMAAPSGVVQMGTYDNVPRPPPGAQIPRSPHAMTRDPVEAFPPMTNGLWR
ncbi:hypothetical protein FRC01_010820, partial [Tulasnella sp. 417]